MIIYYIIIFIDFNDKKLTSSGTVKLLSIFFCFLKTTWSVDHTHVGFEEIVIPNCKKNPVLDSRRLQGMMLVWHGVCRFQWLLKMGSFISCSSSIGVHGFADFSFTKALALVLVVLKSHFVIFSTTNTKKYATIMEEKSKNLVLIKKKNLLFYYVGDDGCCLLY